MSDRWSVVCRRLDGCKESPVLTPGTWVGTVLESCIRDVALGRIAAHSSVTDEMVAEWHRLNPGRVADVLDGGSSS